MSQFQMRFADFSLASAQEGAYVVSFDLEEDGDHRGTVEVILPAVEFDSLADSLQECPPGTGRVERVAEAMAQSAASVVQQQVLEDTSESITEAFVVRPHPVRMRVLLFDQAEVPLPRLEPGRVYRRWRQP